MSNEGKYKKQRASTRQGRASATRRQDLEQLQVLLNDVLRLSAAAGRAVTEPFSSADPMSERQLRKEEQAMRKENELLDRRVPWSALELFAFIGEPELGLNETRAARAEKIVKRVKARLVGNGRCKGAGLFDGCDGAEEWPAADGQTTYGFANAWARRVGFVPPGSDDNEEAERQLQMIEERRPENEALEASRRSAEGYGPARA